MAIHATFHNTGGSYTNVYIKLSRIWGSKDEQWNAWVDVYESLLNMHSLATFSIQAPYVEGENPYTVLYTALSLLPQLSDVVHDVDIEVIPEIVPEVVDILPKRVRQKRAKD